MGLDIDASVSKKDYHCGYFGIHMVRRLALLICGYPETIGGENSSCLYPTCYIIPAGAKGEEISNAIHAAELAGHLFPNLLLHSDCEGKYTKSGKVLGKGWLTGNSVGLLEELEMIKRDTNPKHKSGRSWEIFNMLYALVKDEVKNGNGILKFC